MLYKVLTVGLAVASAAMPANVLAPLDLHPGGRGKDNGDDDAGGKPPQTWADYVSPPTDTGCRYGVDGANPDAQLASCRAAREAAIAERTAYYLGQWQHETIDVSGLPQMPGPLGVPFILNTCSPPARSCHGPPAQTGLCERHLGDFWDMLRDTGLNGSCTSYPLMLGERPAPAPTAPAGAADASPYLNPWDPVASARGAVVAAAERGLRASSRASA